MFRTHIDRNRETDIYKVISPVKNLIAKKIKRKDFIYFPELNAIFHHSPKCGGTSIVETLGQKYKMKKLNWINAMRKNSINFTFVRNPYSRLVSSYVFLMPKKVFREKFNLKKGASFEEYLRVVLRTKDRDSNIHFARLSYQHQMKRFPQHFHFVGKIENFQEDFNKLCKLLKIPSMKIKHKNKTSHDHWQKYYTSRTKNNVYRKYKKDFEFFGYNK